MSIAPRRTRRPFDELLLLFARFKVCDAAALAVSDAAAVATRFMLL